MDFKFDESFIGGTSYSTKVNHYCDPRNYVAYVSCKAEESVHQNYENLGDRLRNGR